MARDSRGHLVDPVGGVEKVSEQADIVVDQRQTWTKGVKKLSLTSMSPKFQTFETIYGRRLSILVHPTVDFSHWYQFIVYLHSYTELFICLHFRYFNKVS